MTSKYLRTVVVLACAFLLCSQAALSQHTPCNPGEFLKNSCPAGLTGQAGTQVTVPIAKICPKPGLMSWITVTCPPPGCLTWSHSTRLTHLCTISPTGFTTLRAPAGASPSLNVALDETEDMEPDADGLIDETVEEEIVDVGEPCADEDVVATRESFTDEDMVITEFQTLEEDGPASFVYQTAVASDLEAGATHFFRTTAASAILQMLDNVGDQATQLKGEVTFNEALTLADRDSDMDRFFHLENDAVLVLENTGGAAVRLEVSLHRRVLPAFRPRDGELIATGYPEIGLASDWNETDPGFHSLVYAKNEEMTRLEGPAAADPMGFEIELEPGESWSGDLPAEELMGDVEIRVLNLSGYDAWVDKQIILSRDESLPSGQRHFMLAVDAGDMDETLTSEDAPLRNVMSTLRLQKDQPGGTVTDSVTEGFSQVDLEARSVARKVWVRVRCWKTWFTSSYTVHFLAGSTVEIDGGIPIPSSAVPGQTLQQWYTVNAMAGAMNQTINCHPVVTVVP